MNWTSILTQLFEMVIIPLLGVATVYITWLVKTKINETKTKTDNELLNKYLTMLNETITDCVLATTQTYVDSLKQAGKFDAEAQKIAFEKTYNAVMDILADEAKEYLTATVGDLQVYVNNKIEAEVKVNK